MTEAFFQVENSWKELKFSSAVKTCCLYNIKIQIKAEEKWLEAKQSIKWLKYLKYFEVYGRTRQVFLLFS